MVVSSKVSKNIIANYGVGVQSECGKLEIVVMHRPGQELARLREDNLEDLLYDAMPDLHETHKAHDVFSQYLRDQGVGVLYLTELLRETLDSNEDAQHALINGMIFNYCYKDSCDQGFLMALREWLLNRTADQLTDDVIVGVAYTQKELGTSTAAQNLLNTENFNHEFIIPPLPNLLFIRDLFSIIEKNVFIWQMAKPARRNEPLIFRIISEYHPQLSTSGLNIVEWQKTHHDQKHATIEGGDVAYLGDGVLLIGCGERTNHAGVEALVRTGIFREVIAVMIPAQRDSMHLDTILSSVGRHAFTLHGRLANQMEVFTVEMNNNSNNGHAEVDWISHGSDVKQALRELLNDSELKFYDAQDEETSIVEQRECRHNVLVVDNNHIVTYQGGDLEKGMVHELTRHNQVKVGLIPTKGLLEGGGGAHCMSNAMRRREKEA